MILFLLAQAMKGRRLSRHDEASAFFLSQNSASEDLERECPKRESRFYFVLD
jgi:hypothetical protein